MPTVADILHCSIVVTVSAKTAYRPAIPWRFPGRLMVTTSAGSQQNLDTQTRASCLSKSKSLAIA